MCHPRFNAPLSKAQLPRNAQSLPRPQLRRQFLPSLHLFLDVHVELTLLMFSRERTKNARAF
jgi:hypothetical protein